MSQTNLKSSFFPGSLRSLVMTEAVFIGAEKSGYDVTCGLTDKLIVHFPKYVANSNSKLLINKN